MADRYEGRSCEPRPNCLLKRLTRSDVRITRIARTGSEPPTRWFGCFRPWVSARHTKWTIEHAFVGCLPESSNFRIAQSIDEDGLLRCDPNISSMSSAIA